MKPVNWIAAGVMSGGLLLSGCAPASPPPGQRNDADDGWTQPPLVTSAEVAGATLIISGMAEPGARVVLRNDAGGAYAASADGRGRFEIRMIASTNTILLRPETQVGQDSAPSPERLLIINGGEGPIVVLRPGAPARRLGVSPVLAAVDSDGRMTLASGKTAMPLTVAAGDRSARVTPDSAGRWSLLLESAEPREIRVGDRRFFWPGDTIRVAGTTEPAVGRAGEGWRINWTAVGGTRQSTWLPDA